MIDAESRLQTGYGKSVDLWALGILIYEMLLGESPFTAESPATVHMKVGAGRFEEEQPQQQHQK